LVVLDTTVTPELAAEGIAKDLVRVVQQARRQAGLQVTDRIVLTIDAPPAVLAAAREHEQFIAGEVLARRVDYAPVPDGFAGVVGDVRDSVLVRVAVAVVSA
jgi:isoleucyl-tRNA synthetase